MNNRLLTILAIAGKTKPAPHDREQGQSLIEFSLIFPLLFLLIVNVVNFGSFMYAWITVASAARAGAQYMITGGASIYAPDTPISSQVSTLITNDISSLPNKSSLVVAVCTNNSGVALTGTTLCSSTDPETSLYTIAQIDVTYTYNPMIPLWKFPGLGVNATLPTSTIHRKAVMRVLN